MSRVENEYVETGYMKDLKPLRVNCSKANSGVYVKDGHEIVKPYPNEIWLDVRVEEYSNGSNNKESSRLPPGVNE